MHTKFLAAVSTFFVTCTILVAFQGNGNPSGTAHAGEVSAPYVASWDLSGFANGLASAIKMPEPEVVVEAAKPARRRYVARLPKFRAVKSAPKRPASSPRAAAPALSGSSDPVIVATIQEFNSDISTQGAQNLARMIENSADRYGVDPYLVAALVSQESAFYQSAVSYVGAQGLGQLMPETAAELGVNPNSAEENLDGAVRYLAQNLQYWSLQEDPIAFALASYNAGAGNVEKYGGVPPFEETQNYVVVIKQRYSLLRTGQVVTSA